MHHTHNGSLFVYTFRYTSIGTTALEICSLQRGHFVSMVELIMGPKRVRRFSNKIVKDHALVTVPIDDNDAQ